MNKIILEREKYIPPELYRYRRIDNENIMCDKHVDALKKESAAFLLICTLQSR